MPASEHRIAGGAQDMKPFVLLPVCLGVQAKPSAGQKAEKKLKAKRAEKASEKREGAGAAPAQSKKDKAKKAKPSGPSGPKVGKIAVKGGAQQQKQGAGKKQKKQGQKPGQQQGQKPKPKPSGGAPAGGRPSGDDVKVTIMNEVAFNAGPKKPSNKPNKPKQQNKPKAGVKANLGGGRPNAGQKLSAKLGAKRQIHASAKREGAGAGGAPKPKKMVREEGGAGGCRLDS